jgi:uncharacterized hydantoinase/oxoprolinase family protein
MARDREVDERLWLVCDTLVEADAERIRSMVGEMARDNLEEVLAIAIGELLDAEERAEHEIERFQRRLAKRPRKLAS